MIKKIFLLLTSLIVIYIIYLNVTPGYYQSIPCGCGLKYQTNEEYKTREENTLEIDSYTGTKRLKRGILCATCRETMIVRTLRNINRIDFNKGN